MTVSPNPNFNPEKRAKFDKLVDECKALLLANHEVIMNMGKAFHYANCDDKDKGCELDFLIKFSDYLAEQLATEGEDVHLINHRLN